MRWIESAGGPLVALPSRLVAAWRGTREQHDAVGKIDDVGLLPIASEFGEVDVLVLWDEPMATTYLAGPGLIVQWRYGDDEESLLALAAAGAEPDEWETVAELELGDDEGLVLFDAADAGADVGADDRLEVSWPRGRGFVEVAEAEDDANAAKLIRFRRG